MSEFGQTIIMEYEIVYAGKETMAYLELGWKLYGSPFVDKEGFIRQAMTRGV